MTKKVNIQDQHDPVTRAVAYRIASLRKAQGLTFEALARRAAVAKGTLVQIEQERGNPSISTLCQLAAALGVSMADLVAPVESVAAPVTLVPEADARCLWRGPHGGSALLLAGASGPDTLELWRWDLFPGERFDAQRHTRGTREIIHVVSGRLCLEVDGQSTLIASGATALARTDRPHAYANPGKSPVRFFMTVDEPATAP